MNIEKFKVIAAIILFVLAIVLPGLILISGGGVTALQLLSQNPETNILSNMLISLLIAGGVFLVLVSSALFLLFRVKDLSWLGASLPYLFGTAYTASIVDMIPDLAPFITKIDDGTVVSIGAIFSFILALKRNPRTPKWVLIPLLIAAVYTFFGGVIPGGLDEIIVQALSFLAYAYGTTHNLPELQDKTLDPKIEKSDPN